MPSRTDQTIRIVCTRPPLTVRLSRAPMLRLSRAASHRAPATRAEPCAERLPLLGVEGREERVLERVVLHRLAQVVVHLARARQRRRARRQPTTRARPGTASPSSPAPVTCAPSLLPPLAASRAAPMMITCEGRRDLASLCYYETKIGFISIDDVAATNRA